MTVTLDSFAVQAAIAAYQEDESDLALQHAIETYITTAQVRGLVHELPVIPGGVPGYEPLARILALAYDQSAKGKGKERHANARPFDKQPIMEIGRMLASTCDGELYQVMKKVQEASGMISRGNTQAAKAELLGAIVYSAAAYLLIEESENQ